MARGSSSNSNNNTLSSDKNGIKLKVPKFDGDVINLHRFLTDFDLFIRQIPSLRPLSGKQPLSADQLHNASSDEVEKEETFYFYVRTALPSDLAAYLTAQDSAPYNGCDLLQRVRDHYQISSDSYALQIERKINEFSIAPTDDLVRRITELDNMLNFLDRARQGKTEPQKVQILLRMLTQDFEHLVKKWRSSGKITKPGSYMKLREQVISHGAFFAASGISTTSTAFSAQVSNEPRSNNCFRCGRKGHLPQACRYKESICHHCNKKGHIRPACHTLKREKRENKSHTSTNPPAIPNEKSNGNSSSEKPTSTANYVSRCLEFLVDSGASCHFTSDLGILTNVCEIQDMVCVANGAMCQVTHAGDLKVMARDNIGIWRTITLRGVKFSPNLSKNLISVKSLIDQNPSGNKLVYDTSPCIQIDGFKLPLKSGYLIVQAPEQANAVESLHYWHHVLAHATPATIRKTSKLVDNLELTNENSKLHCEVCLTTKSKMSKRKLPAQDNSLMIKKKGIKFLDRASVDIMGPLTPSIMGERYLLMIVDQASLYKWAYPLKTRDGQHEKIRNWTKLYDPVAIRSDNSRENRCSDFRSFREYTERYTPQQNPAEVAISTITADARALLAGAKLPTKFWPFACLYAVFIKNRLVPTARKDTPLHAAFGIVPNISDVKPFGSKVFIHIPKPSRAKFDDVAHQGIFLGYSQSSMGFLVLDCVSKRLISTSKLHFTDRAGYPILGDLNSTLRHECFYASTSNYFALGPCFSTRDPTSVSKALERDDAHEWAEAIQTEIRNLDNFECVQVVPRKQALGRELGSTIVLKQKYLANGLPDKKKARICAQGFSQVPGIDYNETYAPVASEESIRILIGFASSRKYKLFQYDITAAYLHAPLEEELFMRIPVGLSVSEEGSLILDPTNTITSRKNYSLKLNKSLYGLRQSSKNWYTELSKVLSSIGLTGHDLDKALYSNEECIMVSVVDDILLACKGYEPSEVFQRHLTTNKIKLKRKTFPDIFSGHILTITEKGIYLSQQKAISDLLDNYGMIDCKRNKYPHVGSYLPPREESEDTTNFPYRSLVGSLLWLSKTRPDICFAVNCLARHVNNACERHVSAAKHLLGYLKSTRDYGLFFPIDAEPDIRLYVDSDFACDTTTRKSQYGYLLMAYEAPIAFKSTRQSSVSLSTCDAEFFAIAEAIAACKRFVNILSSCDTNCKFPATIFTDNLPAINSIMRDKRDKFDRKHVDTRYCYIREEILEHNHYVVSHVPSSENIADIFTKPLKGTAFRKHFNTLLKATPPPLAAEETGV